MPIVKRKPVQPVPVSEALEAAHARHEAPPVFYLATTGEVFAEYEHYAARLSYYHQRIFQCEVSGKSNLTYFEAAESEAQHTRAIQAQFPDALKAPILQAVQFQTVSRLSELVERVADSVKARFFPGETVLVDREGGAARQLAMVRAVDAGDASEVPPLSLALDAAPSLGYTVQLAADDGAWTGETLRVRATQLSRERHALSKTILRRFLRDSVSREAGATGVWRVREPLARKYAIPTEIPPDVIEWQQSVRDAQAAKRRRPSEGEAPRKRTASDAPSAAKVLKFPCEDTRLDAISAAELQTETPGELARRMARPSLGGDELLGVPSDLFEPYLAVYYFFLALGEPLGISSIALDDFESALRHPVAEPPCVLLAEMHAVLLNAIVRDGPHSRDLAPAAVAQRLAAVSRDEASPLEGEEPKDEAPDEASSDVSDSPEREVFDAAREIGRGWQRSELHDELRSGWERSLVGCLVDRATPEALPRFLGILSHLTGVAYDDDLDTPSVSLRTVAERYPLLPLSDKIHVLQFLCELAVLTRGVKAYYETCEAHLTELRKERVEISRTRKRTLEQRLALDAPPEGGAMDVEPDEPEPEAPAAEASDSDSERDELASDHGSDGADHSAGASDWDSSDSEGARDERYKRLAGTRQEALREKAQQREAEAARLAAAQARAAEQVRETKQLREERRRLEDTAARLARREDALEREFRRYAQIPRLRPLGRDRFLDRYYWLDGIGAAEAPTGAYQAARIFVQAPSRREWEALCAQYTGGRDALAQRRSREHGAPTAWECGSWGVYTQPEQVEELIAWLRPHGVREHALKAQLLKHRDTMEGGMRRRTDDIALGVREPAVVETRRSARVRSEQSSQLRLPYMQWRNTARD
ncbi:dolichyl-P-Glc:Glc1Man9GlcNAc2-PP-dolichol alpha-1,3-glucosyltransferase [Malassezia caprae]|uniref:Dolichyl-P-Glc:Glc1Man9GlcNAc2-PP-dolichol alpha-1,3-glucosyltransferase n=1 Tax=Malassezia caprae TaxID=1381934 RepID=A0AAF0IWW2_9BASI|nr:dolichyl-P-Glc:Glc1Man9GlcNAc2-PP-dolichol alpha-1,3-glucosyltransferase [Malassezia caprae]